MGLLDDIHVPSASDEDANRAYEIVDLCKKYYDELTAAKYAVSVYLILYERAQESLDFATKQFNIASDEFDKNIEDQDKKAEIINALKEANENIEEMNNIINSKVESINKISSTFDKYLEKIVEINNAAYATIRALGAMAWGQYQGAYGTPTGGY